VRIWGNFKTYTTTSWKVLSGPVIGFRRFNKWLKSFSIIVGDGCRPKYFGARKLTMQLGEKREVEFDWQASEADYFLTCLSQGLFHVQNSGKLRWVAVTGNKATFFPAIQNVYPSTSYLSLHYEGETFLLELSLFILYNIPAPLLVDPYPLITSKFADVEEYWLPYNSTFRFSNNKLDERVLTFGEL